MVHKRLSGQQGRWEGESEQPQTSTMCDPLNLKERTLWERGAVTTAIAQTTQSTFPSLAALQKNHTQHSGWGNRWSELRRGWGRGERLSITLES